MRFTLQLADNHVTEWAQCEYPDRHCRETPMVQVARMEVQDMKVTGLLATTMHSAKMTSYRTLKVCREHLLPHLDQIKAINPVLFVFSTQFCCYWLGCYKYTTAAVTSTANRQALEVCQEHFNPQLHDVVL